MAENISLECNIYNVTGNKLIVQHTELSWGKFLTYPQEVANNAFGYFHATGRANSSSGTAGKVHYQAYDGTLFIIDFEINWGTAAGYIRNSMVGPNATQFVFKRKTDGAYSIDLPTDYPGSSPVMAYFFIGKAS